MNSVSQHIALQVLVCTIGDEGIARVASSHLPAVAGVEYVVCWQAPTKSAPVPRSLAGRGDVRVLRHSSSGVSRNRNFAIGAATAPLALFGDDDVDYSAQGLACLIETARSLPDADIICCRHTRRGLFPKPYPESAVTVAHAPRGYYTTSFEIAFRPERVRRAGLRFNEHFGIGAPFFICGEEVLFVYDARRASVGVYVVPVTVCVHDHLTTGARDLNTPDFIKTNGAVQARLHPATFLPRLMVHAWRSSRSGGVGWRGYMNHALRGVFYACRHRVFCRKD